MEYRWYKNGRMYVKSWDIERINIFGITQEYYDDHIGNHPHIEGNLFLQLSKITSLGNLKSVSGDLHSFVTELASLGNLETVGGGLDLSHTKITSLGNLKHVGSNLIVLYTNLTSLGKLETVGGDIRCLENSPTHKLFMNSKFKDQVEAF